MSAQPATADEFDTFNVIGGSLLRYESNVFRAPDNAAPQSDTINVSYIGFMLDKPYSLQRFTVKATNTYTNYATNDSLNNNAVDYLANWNWAVTPRLTGNLSSQRTQTQVPFSLTGGNQKNILTTNTQTFNFDGTVSGAWHVIGGYGYTDAETEQPVLTVPSQRYRRVEGGLRYVTSAGNTISAVYRYIPTDLTDQPLNPVTLIDTNFHDSERELRGEWKLSGKSTVLGRLSWKQRVNEHFRQRDFSGTAGDIRYIWLPTGKLTVSAALSRDYLPYVAYGNVIENSTYRVDGTASLNALWQVTAKTGVRGALSYTHSDFRGPVFFPLTGPLREDNVSVGSIGADWAIARAVLLTATFEHSQRSSNQSQFQFRNNMFLLGASLKF